MGSSSNAVSRYVAKAVNLALSNPVGISSLAYAHRIKLPSQSPACHLFVGRREVVSQMFIDSSDGCGGSFTLSPSLPLITHHGNLPVLKFEQQHLELTLPECPHFVPEPPL